MLIVYVVNYGIWDGIHKSTTYRDKIAVFSTKKLAEEFVRPIKNIDYEIIITEVDNNDFYYL